MTIQASEVSKLRQMTGCGMMDCKKALTEASGDLEKACDILREKGMSKAANKANRIAAEGCIKVITTSDHKHAVMLEVNSETDFVARDDNFVNFVNAISELALNKEVNDIDVLNNLLVDGEKTVEAYRQELVAKIGENISVRRIAYIETTGLVGSYVHGNKIGVLVAIENGDENLARDVAMHIAAAKPLVISPDQVPENVVNKEREIYKVQAEQSGKPEAILEKIVEGKVKKFLDEVSLVGQPFVKNPDMNIGQLLKEKDATVISFIRFELGEGIEKKSADFAEEVMAQVKGQ